MKKKIDFNPFPGLKPYKPEDGYLFFGREEESDELIFKLQRNRYITVLGTSGSGKSSLIFGGILPKILNLKTIGSSIWKIISLRPGNDPIGNLALAISCSLTEGQKNIDKEKVTDDLLNNSLSITDFIRKYHTQKSDNILIIIDQFEDIFRYSRTENQDASGLRTKKFVDFLISSLSATDLKIFIILALRYEYLGECSRYKGLTQFVNLSNYFIPEMGADSCRKIIEGPLNQSDSSFEPELVEILINEAKYRTDLLPVLQHSLMRTWVYWKKKNQPYTSIERSDYEIAGTMDKAISIHADEVYEKLDQHGKKICETLFKTITGKGPDSKEICHPVEVKTIRSIAECSTEELIEVVEEFRRSQNSFLLPSEETTIDENTFIDIRYECLIRSWYRLKKWIDEEASSKEMYLRLSEASALYQSGKTGLLKQTDLFKALDWRDSAKPLLSWAVKYDPAFERAMVYLRTSEKAYLEEERNKVKIQKSKVKRTRIISGIFGFFILLAAGLIHFNVERKSSAVKQYIISEKLRNEAVKEKNLADSFAAVVIKHNIISDSIANAAIGEASEAREQKIVAEIQKLLAEKNADEARRQKNLSEKENEEIQRLRMLSVGKSMSLKSLQEVDQKDLQVLLAYQAYLFNKRNMGPVNDADIYAGLYKASLRNGGPARKLFKGHLGEIRSIAFIPGKNEFFTAGKDGQVLKWTLEKNDQAIEVIYKGNDIIEAIAVSPDASWLACGCSTSSIKMLPLKANNTGYEMNGHKGNIKSLIFSYDGKFLYSAALDGKVLKWDIAARTSTNVSSGEMEITSIDISSKGKYLAGVSSGGEVIVWNQESKSDNFRIETTGKNIKVVRFNPDNNLLAIGDKEGNIELWDIELQKKLAYIKAHSAQINDIRFNTKLKQMATAGMDRKLKIFNINDPADLSEPPITLADNEGFVLVMQFSPDGLMIISGESEGGILLSRPSNSDYLAHDLCSMVSRDFTQKEWNQYVGKDIPLERTCQTKNYNIKIEPAHN